jgi:hypothetical protein
MRLPVLSALRAFAVGPFRSRASLCLAHPARRHPWPVHQQAAHRPRLWWPDRLFWAWRSRRWSGWHAMLVLGWSAPRSYTCHRTSLGLVISRRDAIRNGGVCLMCIDMSEGGVVNLFASCYQQAER